MAESRVGPGDVRPDETRAIYGDAKLARLAALKRTWDPDNVFHLDHNVAPGSPELERPGDEPERPHTRRG